MCLLAVSDCQRQTKDDFGEFRDLFLLTYLDRFTYLSLYVTEAEVGHLPMSVNNMFSVSLD